MRANKVRALTRTMSAQTEDTADVEPRVKQTVTVIGYAEKGKYADERAFAQQLDGGNDYWHTVEKTDVNYGIWVNGEQVMDSYDAKKICRAFDLEQGERAEFEDSEGRHMVAKVWAESEEDYQRRPGQALDVMRKSFEEKVEDGDGVSGLNSRSWSTCYWQNDIGETKAKINNSGIKPQRVLMPKDERNDDNRFKGDDKVMAVQFTIKLGEATERETETWYNEVVLEFLKHVRRWQEIDNVEMTDCETHTVEEGDCFDF